MPNLNLNRINSELLQKMQQGQMVRMIYLGSSNTQRHLPGTHWGDWLEIGLKKHYGAGLFQALNLGVSGETSLQLLHRFERDVAAFHSDAVLITVGGNDSNPIRNISAETYRNNLLDLQQRTRDCGAMSIFQTYYGCDLKNMTAEFGAKMNAFMQVIREVASATNSPLIDQYERWQPLMDQSAMVRQLLRDPMHTTDMGNAVMGINLLRAFDCPLSAELKEYAPDAIRIDAQLES